MSLTVQQAKIAQTIADECDRLVKQGKSQATILGQMSDHMPHFKQLLDADVLQEAADKYPGFRHFANILERTAQAIGSGALAVPGKQSTPRQNGSIGENRRLAAAMDLRMRQLAEEGVPAPAVLDRMSGHLLDLHRIWTSTSDDQLISLCHEYPGFHRFAAIMEDAAVAERQKPSRSYDDLPELPDSLKDGLASLLGSAAKLESDFQAIIDAAGAPAPGAWIETIIGRKVVWERDLTKFRTAALSAGIPQKSLNILLPMLDRMAQRIVELSSRVQGR
jgi:hypothetical protein